MWFVGVEVEQETSAPPPKKNPVSAPALDYLSLKILDSLPLIELSKLTRTFPHFK